MYTSKNFKTKKELKAAVDAWNAYAARRAELQLPVADTAAGHEAQVDSWLGITAPTPPRAVTYFQPGPFGGNEPRNGTFCCEGPHYPQPHKWYATCTAKDGVIVKVK